METDIAIELKHVYENYDIEIRTDEKVIRESFEALKDISFVVKKGEAVAIIGSNGSGKSTILRLIAGLLKPEKGEIKVNGRVGSLLDLGAGFHPELTGRDNLRLNASLYHFSKNEFEAKYQQILEFADIGKFIDVPVRCYSQGMYVRLAFSLAIHVDPDILLIDDCLSVGDDNFQLKSIDKALELKARDKTIIFVTHNFTLAKRLCERGIYIREHTIFQDSSVEEAVLLYLMPSKVDQKKYPYLSAKIQKEAIDRRESEEAEWKTDVAARREAEEAVWQREVIARREAEEAVWQREVIARREACGKDLVSDRGKEKGMEVSLCTRPLKLAVAFPKVRILCDDVEVMGEAGILTYFRKDSTEFCSFKALWRIKKISDVKIICFLRWPDLQGVRQCWLFAVSGSGGIDFQVSTRIRSAIDINDERIEFWPQVTGGIEDKNRMGTKSRSLYCGDQERIIFRTYQDDQICGVVDRNPGGPVPYFLKVCHDKAADTQQVFRREVFFKGRIYSGKEYIKDFQPDRVRQSVGTGRIKFDFCEGSCQISHGEKILTSGFGFYTSIFAQGIWHDSSMAKWKIESFSKDTLLVKGFWPRVPVIQIWRITIEKHRIILDIRMKILRDILIYMQEASLMLTSAYSSLRKSEKWEDFPEDMTSDDFFRMCSLVNPVDGLSAVAVTGKDLPKMTIMSSLLPGYRMIIENSMHIQHAKARLLHCLRTYSKEEGLVGAGEYQFFKGEIRIGEEAQA